MIYHQMVLYEVLDLPMSEVFRKLSERHKGAKR